VWGPTGPSLCSQHSKLKMTDIGKPFVACPALQAPMQESHDYLMAPKCHSRLTQGLRKAATETRPVTLEQDTQWNICIEPVIHFWWNGRWNGKFDIVCVEARLFQIRSQLAYQWAWSIPNKKLIKSVLITCFVYNKCIVLIVEIIHLMISGWFFSNYKP